MADVLLQKRATTTGGRLQPIPKGKVDSRPKTHYPFITKIQVVRIRKDESENENASESERSSMTQQRSVRPTNLTYTNPPVTRSSSEKSLCDEQTIFVPRKESLDEARRQRRQMLGERASARIHVRNDNDSLYRPRLTSNDCRVQMLLARELTEHLESVGRETRSARRQRLPALHSRATKGERTFGINWK